MTIALCCAYVHDDARPTASFSSLFFFLHAEKKLKDLKRPLPGDIGRPAVKSMLRSLESSRKDHMDRLLSERDDYSGCAVVSNQAEAGGGVHDDDSGEPRCGCCLPLYHWLLPHKQAISSEERLLLIETDELQRDESETEGLLDDDDGGGDNGWCKGALIMVYYRAAYITMKFKFKTKHMYILGKHQSSKLSKNDSPKFIYFAQRISAKNPAIILLETELSCYHLQPVIDLTAIHFKTNFTKSKMQKKNQQCHWSLSFCTCWTSMVCHAKFGHCNRRNFRTRFNFVLFVLSA